MRRLILFDIDGTILVSGGAGLVALRRIFSARHGVEDPMEGIDFHGRTDYWILDAIAERHLGRKLSPDEADELRGAYEREIVSTLAASEGFRVMPGAVEMVRALEARDDVVLGLATGNFEAAAYAKLGQAELAEPFGFGGFGSDHLDREELTRIAVERGREVAGPEAPALVVGDTIHDVRCARAVGAKVLAVATGNASTDTLRAAGATWAVETLEAPEALAAVGLA